MRIHQVIDCEFLFFFSGRRRHTRCSRDWSSDVCSSDLIRRMRHDYARRRAAMTAVFHGGDAGRLLGDEAGMHMILETRRPAAEVAAAAATRGGAVATLDRYFAGPVTRNGLVLGYGGAALPHRNRGCEVLAAIPAPPPTPHPCWRLRP